MTGNSLEPAHHPARRYKRWTDTEIELLRTEYGRIPANRLAAELQRTRISLHGQAERIGLTKISTCKTCGRNFLKKVKNKVSYCSSGCRRRANTLTHGRYVAANRIHINEYVRKRKLAIWGESNSEIALEAENIALDRILPRLGFTDLYHASSVNRFVPFDVVATRKGERVLIDVTTCVSKSLRKKPELSIAEALRMPLYILFVKPDLSKYQLALANGAKTLQVNVKELVAIE